MTSVIYCRNSLQAYRERESGPSGPSSDRADEGSNSRCVNWVGQSGDEERRESPGASGMRMATNVFDVRLWLETDCDKHTATCHHRHGGNIFPL